MNNLTYAGFKHDAEHLGYDVDLHYSFHQVAILVQDLGAPMGGNVTVATVDRLHRYWFKVYDYEDTLLTHNDWKTIITLCRMLAQTPIDKRYRHKKRSLADVLMGV